MQINLLGPVEVSSGNGRVALGGPKPRALLAMLALEAGSTVPAGRLIDGLWGEEPPPSAAKMVQVYISQLRKVLAAQGAADVITTYGRGYQLQLGRERVDACRFERLLAQGAAREALSLWRGPALADVAEEPFAAAEIRRLEDLRATAVEIVIDHDLDAGRHREVLPEIEALLAQEPLRERLHAQRMLALYRAGRQADALEAYRRARATLVEQIGLEPGPELRRMHEAILRQDPSLDPPGQELAGAPLVGRDAELAYLRDLWRRARAGSGAGVVITGPPGIGKTRLVQELADEVRRDGGAVAYGELEELDGPMLLVLGDVAQVPAVEPDRPVLAVATAVEAEGETLPLAPLGREEVAALARYHAGALPAVEPPVDRLLAESGGVPARVHRAAAVWARVMATQRVGEASARASSERAEWHLAGDDVATQVVELQTVRERAELAGADALPACPFKGLASFDVDDAPVFFGREQLVADMIARLPGARLMGLVGPSGSGKSSALRAGLLAALREGVLPGSERWPLALLRPGAHPLAELGRATAELPAGERWIVAVDQFEETFTACADAAERTAFIDALVACARDPRRRTLVLIAVRADFYGHCARFPELSRLLGANHVLVGPMRRHELRRAIELPARRAGLRVEPTLADALLADVEGEPGALPMLSTTLLELWQARDDRRLTLSAYERTGGVLGAVARLAEAAYARLEPAQREQARRIMLRLAGDGGVRARVPIGDLDDAQGDSSGAVLSVLAADRLITIGEGEVEVAHEALLREWPRLQSWLDEDAEGRRLQRQLTRASRDWATAGRDPSELFRGARLAAALEWAATHTAELNATERDFLDGSRRASGRAQRRVRVVLAGVATLLVLSVIAGVVALDQRSSARAEATAGAAQRLGAQALADDDLGRSLLLARQGLELDDTVQTRSNLLAALLRTPAAIGVLRGDGDGLVSIALSPNDRTLAMIDSEGTLSLFDTHTRRLEAREPMPGFSPRNAVDYAAVLAGPIGLDALRFSDDGTRLAVGGLDPAVLDPRTRKLVMPKLSNVRYFFAMHFAPDGRTVLAGIAGPGRAISAQRFAVATGRPIGAPRSITQRNVLVTPMLTQDGTRVITTMTGRTEIRDATTLRVLQRWPAGSDEAALSPDGHTLLLGESDGSVRFLDLGNGDVRTASGGHGGPVLRATFGPNGRTAVTAGEDDRVIVWDARRAAITETLEGHAGQTTSLAISRDGRTLYTGALDGDVLIWDLIGERRFNRRFQIGPLRPSSFSESLLFADRAVRAPRAFMSTALSRDGRILAAGHDDGTVSLFDVSTLRPMSTFRAVPRGPVRGMGYVPHTGQLVVGGDGGFLGIFDPDTGRLTQRLPGDTPRGAGLPQLTGLGTQVPPSFSADGRLMATADFGDNVLRWTMQEGRAVGTPRSYRPAAGTLDVSLSPNGRTMVVVAGLGVEVVDVATLRRRADLPGADSVRSAQFTPDGRYVIGASHQGWARMWSTKTWRPVGPALAGHTDAALSASVSPDGRTVATGSADGTIRLFDVATQKPVGGPLPAIPNRPVAPLFTPDGDYLLAITSAGQSNRWDARPSAWAQRACAVAGRTLTRAEWNDALPGRTYAPACTT